MRPVSGRQKDCWIVSSVHQGSGDVVPYQPHADFTAFGAESLGQSLAGLHDKGDLSRPEGVHQAGRHGRYSSHDAIQHLGGADQQKQRFICGSGFDGKYPLHRRWISGIASQAVKTAGNDEAAEHSRVETVQLLGEAGDEDDALVKLARDAGSQSIRLAATA